MLTAASQGAVYWDLWCLNVDRVRAVMMPPYPRHAVTDAHRIGRRRIRVWTVSYRTRDGTWETVVDKTPHVWTCP